MQRKLKSALKLTENDCCDFCDQVLVDDPDPCVMYCGQCTRDIGTSKEPRRSSFGHEKIQMKERVTLPTMPTVHRASFGGVGQAVNVRGSLVHTARASVTGQHSEEGPAKPVQAVISQAIISLKTGIGQRSDLADSWSKQCCGHCCE